MSTQVLEEEQSGGALEEAPLQVLGLPEDIQAPPTPGRPRGEDPPSPGVRLQHVRVQEQQQGHAEEPLHTAAHEQLQFRLRCLRQAVQDQEGLKSSREAEPQRRAADRLRRLRALQQEPARAEGPHEVQALQARVHLQNLSQRHDHEGEPGAAPDVARDQGEGALSDLREAISGS